MFDTVVAAVNHLAGVPDNLEQIPPGYVLAAVLDDIELDQCSGYDQIRVLQAHERMRAHYAARSYRTMSAVVDTLQDTYDDEGLVDEAAVAGSAEIAAALRITRRAADGELGLALELQRRLPGVWEALCDGLIDVRRAKALVDNTLHLSIATAREVAATVMDDAPLLTTGQLAAKLRKLCVQADPDDAKERYRHGIQDRRVVVEANPEGTASLCALNIAPDQAVTARNRINKIALDLKRQGDQRSMDQIRADVLVDLLTGPGTDLDGFLHVTIDLATLTGLNNHPGELQGYGPVSADIARQLAQDLTKAEWRWSVTHNETGMPIASGTTRRRPTSTQKRWIQTRYRTCIHPGCRMPAIDSDIDHRTPWAQRRRTQTNDLYPLCRYHHNLKTNHGWTYQPLGNGDFQFTTPLGHTYTTSGQPP